MSLGFLFECRYVGGVEEGFIDPNLYSGRCEQRRLVLA